MELLSEQTKYPYDVIPKSLGLTIDRIADNRNPLWITLFGRYDYHRRLWLISD